MTAEARVHRLPGSAAPRQERRRVTATDSADRLAAGALSDERRRGLVRLANRFVWNVEDAEDVVQEALLAAESSREQLREAGRAEAWLRRIVVQKALVHRRREHTRRRRRETETRPGPEPAPGPEHAAAAREESAMLREAIGRLPAQQRVAITLRHLEGMEYWEIAEVMEIGESTVRFHVREARLALARMMGEPG